MRAEEAGEIGSAAHRRIRRLVFTGLLVLAIVYVVLLAAIDWRHVSTAPWLPEILQEEFLLWLNVVVILCDVLLLIAAKFTNKRWLRWSCVAVAVALTVGTCLIQYILWLTYLDLPRPYQ